MQKKKTSTKQTNEEFQAVWDLKVRNNFLRHFFHPKVPFHFESTNIQSNKILTNQHIKDSKWKGAFG